jgi:hypothetical protein
MFVSILRCMCSRAVCAGVLLLVCIPAILLAGCGRAERDTRPGITGLWAIDGTEKVRQGDLDHWGKTDRRNAVWQNGEIHLFGLRNEVVDFQVIIEAAGTGADSVRVCFDTLRCGSAVITNTRRRSDPFDFVGQHIEGFLEHYIDVQKRSEWWLLSARPLPDDEHVGMIPDALVPMALDHDTAGARFIVGASSLQGVWVDVAIPRTAIAGEYAGDLSVYERGKEHHVPVRLKVFDATLPDQEHLPNHFYSNTQALVVRHGVANGSDAYWKLFRNYENTFHRHRLDLVDGRRLIGDFTRRLAGYYTGEYYTPAYRYDGPGEKHGNTMYSIGTYDQPDHGWNSGFYPDTPAVWQKASDVWESWFAHHAPHVMRFKYMEDEAPRDHWPDIIRKARWIREGTGPGKNLGILVSGPFSPDLYGTLSYWMVEGQAGWKDGADTKGYDIVLARERQKLGERVGVYNGMRPSYGEPSALDNFAADARINPWICWKYAVDFYYYWETAFYAETKANIWKAPWAGSLMYLGEDKTIPSEDRHLKGPVMSIRLKNLRRGFQDYEYLWLAREKALDTKELVATVVPAAFNDYNGSTFTSQADQPLWARRGYVFEEVRLQLANLITSGSAKGEGMP